MIRNTFNVESLNENQKFNNFSFLKKCWFCENNCKDRKITICDDCYDIKFKKKKQKNENCHFEKKVNNKVI